jgi:hypothetical protein
MGYATESPGDGPESGDQCRRGGVGGDPGAAMALTWDGGRGAQRRRLGAALYGPKLRGPSPAGSPTWWDAHRAAAARRDAGAAPRRVSGRSIPTATGIRRSAGATGAWRARQRLSMRQVHTAGREGLRRLRGAAADARGPTTGEVIARRTLRRRARRVQLHLRRGDAHATQRATGSQSHTRAVEYFGGVPAVVVPDQLRTGVTAPCRYEPGPADVRRLGARTTARRSSRRGRRSRATRRRSKSPCRSPSAGFSRGCATRPSSPSPRLNARIASCSPSSMRAR